jgi:hypothetical protein
MPPKSPLEGRPTYVITVRPKPGTDAIRNLRRGLKYLLRICHLRAIKVEQYPAHHVEPLRPSNARRHGCGKNVAGRKAVAVPATSVGHVGAARSVL